MIQSEIDRKSWLASKVAGAFSFEEYLDDIARQVREARSSGTNQSHEYVKYTKLNAQRMNRWLKTLKLESLKFDFEIEQPLTFLTLTESWCGDAAHLTPVLNYIALQNGITLRFLYRDEHPDLMDQYLSNGSRSIPKVVIVDTHLNELAAWGPRPAQAQKLYNTLKANGNIQEIIQGLQRWYNLDEGISTKIEIEALVKSLRYRG